MKKFALFVFAALFAAGVFGATETVNGVTYTYSISNGEATIGDGYSAAIPASTSGELVIPSTIGGCPVTTIGGNAFRGCSSLTSVTIPESVTKIDNYAFSDCSSLRSFDVDSSNPNYASINGLLCSKDGTRLIAGINGDVTIPKSVTTIGVGAFWGCSSLAYMTIPESVTTIEADAFFGCSSLRSFDVDSSNPNYASINGLLCSKDGTRLIAGINGDVTIPKSVTTIGVSAFSGCSSLTSVTIPESVTTIEDFAFFGCSSLTSVSIPESVTTIGLYAFWGTPFYDNQPDGFVILGRCLYEYKGDCPYPYSVTIPDGVTTIGGLAFERCKSLKAVTIPPSVMTIEANAFSGCESLTSVSIPESVTTIGDFAFQGCRSLKAVTIPQSMMTIGGDAFFGCVSLTTVYVAKGDISRVKALLARSFLINVDDLMFEEGDVSRFQLVKTVDGVSYTYFISYGMVTIGSGVSSAISTRTSGALHIPASLSGYPVTTIAERAFANCNLLTSITIPESVTTIGDYAFQNCKNLTEIKIPQSVLILGDGVFSGCSTLMNVEFKGDAPDIGEGLFAETSKRLVVSVPQSSIAWDGGFSTDLPEAWGGRRIAHSGEIIQWLGSNEGPTVAMYVTVTNVVMHYVVNRGLLPNAKTPSLTRSS